MSRLLLFCLALGGVSLAVHALPPRGEAGPGPLHIHQLYGSVSEVGSYSSGGATYPLFGVRLKATVCLRSATEAQDTYPTEIGITHYAVSVSPTRWRPVRVVIDRAPWLVPFGETWDGKACGPVVVDDPIPPGHLGAESLGNPNGCYGAALTIKVGSLRTTKRVLVRCGGLGRG